MAVRQIVCLANSRKMSEHCIAGIEVVNGRFGRWIRPVSDRPGGAISHGEQMCADWGASELLDVLEIDFSKPLPESHQSENVLINPGAKWRKVGRMPVSALTRALQPGNAPLWPRTESTCKGCNYCGRRLRGTKLAQSGWAYKEYACKGCNDKISTDNLRFIKISLALIGQRER